MTRFQRLLWVPVGLALAYALLGWLSLRVAIPPDYVSLVFVPAGVALVAVLTWGRWAVLGVALGSLALNAFSNWHAQGQLFGLNLWVTPWGAAAQAATGAWMIRRWVGYPNALDTPSRVLMFLMLGGPVACLINASLSVPTLMYIGVIPTPEAWFSWWTWWLGDALGVTLFAPLMLVWLGLPRDAWRNRRATVALPMLLAMLLSGAIFYQARHTEERALVDSFDVESRELARLLQRRLDAQSDSMLSVAKLMELSQITAQRDFSEAVAPWLRRYSGTQNFGWSPLVTQASRADFEARLQANGQSEFRILGRDSEGQTFAALPAPYHLPITLVEPLASNRSVLGLDVLVLPATSEAVMATQISGRPEVTQAIRLVQETRQQRGVVMYQAVFARRDDGSPYGPLKGVVSAVFRMDDVITAALGPVAAQRLAICLIDPQGSVGNQRLAGEEGCELKPPPSRLLTLQLPVRFSDRFWEMRITEGPAYRAAHRSWTAWATVALGLLSVSMLGVFLIVITGHGRRTQMLVDQRTAELAGSNEQLLRLAHFDPLTGLANRSHWMAQAQDTLEAAQRHNDQLAVMFIDLDRFKHINDSLGHSLGDRLLVAVAARLRECLRGRDVLARLGGDEFVILLPRLRDREGAAVAARKIMAALSRPIQLDAHEVTASASLGLACYPADGDSIETLLRHADTAMYAAKDDGRNGWRFFSSEMNEHLSQRMFIEMGLRRALQQTGELFLQYQPQIDTRSGRLLGAEALVRWRHPEQGLIGPDRFIAVAEDSGLIEPLGRWVLAQACQQLRAWEDAGLCGLHMAVNISALEFNRPNFLPQVRETLAAARVNPAQVELEITESLLMQSMPELRARLGELTDLGLQLALDDFGTGYSSLGYLKRLPLSRLKIDRSFVVGVPGSAEGEAIIRATVSMAHDLGLGVVAEGVETEDQREFLLSLGCDRLQGYLIARPMDAEVFVAWWQKQLVAKPAALA